MAKQNVTFLERQLEKIVGGVAGAALLFVLVTNLLMSPHTVDVSGQAMGPGPFYGEMAARAEDVRERMRRASPGSQDDSAKGNRVDEMISDSGKWPPLDLIASTPYGKALEDVPGPMPMKYGEKVELAAILPPPRPSLSTGKAAARLGVPRIEQVAAPVDGLSATDELAPTSDLHWVVGAAVFDRKAQRDLFVAANYLLERQDVIVAEIRVQRRVQEGNGTWSDPVVVQPYMRNRVVGKSEVGLVPDGADYSLMPGEDDYIRRFREALATRDAQAKLMRPEFQSFLGDPDPAEDDRFEWVIPRALKAGDGTEIDMTGQDYEVEFLEQPEKGVRRPLAGGVDDGLRPGGAGRLGPRPAGVRGGVGEPLAGAPQGAGAIPWAKETLTKAKEAVDKKNWIEARELLDSIVAISATDLPETHAYKKEAVQMLRVYRPQFEYAETLANRVLGPDAQEGLGPDQDPFWFTDISVRPGETYQYRVSMVLLNQYAGIASLLKDPLDARKLLVQGEWSPWTEAITIPRSKWLFVTSIPPDGGRVSAELNEWLGGKWEKAQLSLATGDVVRFTRGHIALNYGAVLVSADPSRQFQRRSDVRKGETFKYTNENSGAAVFVTALGEVEEHFIAGDVDARREYTGLLAEEKKRREALTGGATGGPAVTPKPVQPGRTPERDRRPERPRSPEGERRTRGRS